MLRQITPLFLALSVAWALLLLQLSAASAAAVVEASAADDVDARPAVVQMSMLFPASSIRRPIVQLLGFSWNDCSSAGAWAKIKSVSLQPDPINLNAKITVAASVAVSHSFGDGTPLAASVEMKKRVFGTWLKLPCIDNVGSCNYGDLCTMRPPPKTCPPEFVKAGVPCKCPFPAGNFTLPGYSFTVDASKIPKFLESGTYQASLVVNSGANQVLCANAELSLA